MTSPTKPLGDGSHESGTNNSAATAMAAALLRTPGPVASLSTDVQSDDRSEAALPQETLHITRFLGGKCYLVTGITGFMGTVLVSPVRFSDHDTSTVDAVACRLSKPLNLVRIGLTSALPSQAEKILREAPEGTKIYVPIRNAPRMSFTDRFWKKVGGGPEEAPTPHPSLLCQAVASTLLVGN